MTLQQGISREIGRERVGSTLRILVDARREGRTEWDAPEIDGRVALDADCVPGRFVQVRVTAAADYDLHASLCTHDAASGAAPSSAGGPAEAPLTQSIPR